MKLLYYYAKENPLKFYDQYERIYGKPDFKVGDTIVKLPVKNQNYTFKPLKVIGFEYITTKNNVIKQVVCQVDPVTFLDRKGRQHTRPGFQVLFDEYEIVKIRMKTCDKE